MSLINQASLVITPNAVKEGVLYSVIPNTTLGDMNVVRATTATRVNSAGLIEEVPYNLLQYSEQFDNAYWLKNLGGVASAPVVTPNVETAPDGTTTADRVVFNLNGGTLTADLSQLSSPNFTSISITRTQSVYIKTTDGTTKVFSFVSPTGTLTAITVTSVYQRFTFTSTGVNSNTIRLRLRGSASGEGTSTSASIAIWGAQYVEGTSAKEYFPTTTRLNIPRIDYTNGSCPSLLVEPQRTNYSLNSNNLSQWINQTTNTTITRIQSGGIAGEFDRLTTTGTGAKGRFVQVSALIGTNAVFSIYLKGTGQVSIGIANAGQTTNIPLTLTTQWQRFETKITTGIAGYMDFSIYVFGGSTVDVSSSQLEFATYATSYIPTIASTVTRNADIISKTSVSSLIGQTEGTIYAEIKVSKLLGTASRYIFHISDGTANNRIYMAFSGLSSNVIRARIFNGGTLQCSIVTSTLTNTGTYKIALAYKNNDIVFYVNGVQIGTDTSATIPTCSRVDLGHNYAGASQFNDGINNANIWKTRLTDAECIALTTL